MFGTLLELVGTSIAVLDQFSFTNKILLRVGPIKKVNVGLNRLTHKTIDEKPEDVQLRKTQEGFNETLKIIDKNYGPFKDDIHLIVFEFIEKQRTVETSRQRIVLAGEKNKYYPATVQDFKYKVEIWKEKYWIMLGFKIIFIGIVLQIGCYFI